MNRSDEDCVYRCKLKWFNESKGFGFLVPEGNPEQDAFVHVSALQKHGITYLGKDAQIECTIKQTENGLFVDKILRVLCEGDMEAHKVKIPLPPEAGEVYELYGRVKWFRADKGYGFVAGQDGMKDIFVHQTCLRRNGVEEDDFKKGTTVIMQVRDVDQGREAVEVRLTTEADDCAAQSFEADSAKAGSGQ